MQNIASTRYFKYMYSQNKAYSKHKKGIIHKKTINKFAN